METDEEEERVNLFDRLQMMSRSEDERDVLAMSETTNFEKHKKESDELFKAPTSIFDQNSSKINENYAVDSDVQQKIRTEDILGVVKTEPIDDDEQLYAQMMSCTVDKDSGRSVFDLMASTSAKKIEDEKKPTKSVSFAFEEPFELPIITKQKALVAMTTLILDYVPTSNKMTDILKIPKELSATFHHDDDDDDDDEEVKKPMIKRGRKRGGKNKRTAIAPAAPPPPPETRLIDNLPDITCMDDVLKTWDAKMLLQVACGWDAALNRPVDQVIQQAIKVIHDLRAENKRMLKSTRKLLWHQFGLVLKLSGSDTSLPEFEQKQMKTVAAPPPKRVKFQKLAGGERKWAARHNYAKNVAVLSPIQENPSLPLIAPLAIGETPMIVSSEIVI